MSTDTPVIRVAGLDVDVVRKNIKNLHLAVYPPLGRVRVAAPAALGDDAIRLAIVSRLPWIRKQRARIRNQERQSRRDMVDGETHYVRGRKYRLRVIEVSGRQGVLLRTGSRLELHVHKGADRDARERCLTAWYRDQLRATLPELVSKWAAVLCVPEPEYKIRRMRTRWGTCNPTRGRIWLNLELAKKSPECLEYVVVHELLHLLEPSHNERFFDLLNAHMPLWRLHRDMLNGAPLADEEWPTRPE